MSAFPESGFHFPPETDSSDAVAGAHPSSNIWGWSRVQSSGAGAGEGGAQPPCQRSLHVAAVLRDKMYIFGGYDGANRVNDFYQFDFATKTWSVVTAVGVPPSPRDRHIAAVHGASFFVFAGFDGTSRVNDFHEYQVENMRWSPVHVAAGVAPSPRHSHASVVYGSSMFVFGGYDGSYRSDFHEFNFDTGTWSGVTSAGRVPRARYRATCAVHLHNMYLFGGHDGTRHLNDVHVFDFDSRIWSMLQCEGSAPIPRDSHVSVVHGPSMYVFGGSTGSAMNDFHELRLDVCKWQAVQAMGTPPGHRFCHIAVVNGESMFVFGGYDGSNRLNDFLEFHFGLDLMACDVPPGTLVADLRGFVDNELLSDITFHVDAGDDASQAGASPLGLTSLTGHLPSAGAAEDAGADRPPPAAPIYAHKMMLMRCSYFRAMLTNEMMESRSRQVTLRDVRRPIMLAILEFLYTDAVEIPLDMAMELFVAADRFGIDRLKRMCEGKMLSSISVENAASILHAADAHCAASLREKCLNYVLANFDAVSKTADFSEMGRVNVELVFEILQKR